MTGTYTAVLDRIVDAKHATLLIEADGDVVDEYVVDVERVPEQGRHEGAVFRARIEDDDVVSLFYRSEGTERRAENAQARLDRLSERLPDPEER